MGTKHWISIILVIICLSGCSLASEDTVTTYCNIYVQDLPLYYEQLNDILQSQISITVILDGISSNEQYVLTLSDMNDFNGSIQLSPGSYLISIGDNPGNEYINFETEAAYSIIEISEGQGNMLPIKILNREEISNIIALNIINEEFQGVEMFSRQVQLDGQVISLEDIKEYYDFTPSTIEFLTPKQIGTISARENERIQLLIQNQTDEILSLMDASIIGVLFTGNNVVFPMGIQLGMPISSIAHKETGIWGLPSSFDGTPFIGIGFGDESIIYEDEDTGDQIVLNVKADNTYISSVIYKFGQLN